MQQQEKFLSVLESHKGILYKVANAYCARDEDRQDLLQETILQLWQSFEKYDDQFRYSTWIYRIALNVAISFYRKENRRKRVSGSFPGDVLSYVDQAPAAPNEDVIFLFRFIASLREIDKGLMLLYLEEKTYKEMADIMGLTETNVATKIGRIKADLKQKFLHLKNNEDGTNGNG